ncbi:sensor histidine kinase [Geovibrio thiophilus]|uniref:Sensor histidine kinase n=1 Tax=Geovibrio thiophilus TaxID=139438 RepID=A0A3R5YYL3_9BACT|nr:sensor histidine kinase [Geovibrio thiophilus]QAR32622.1 sensor histidine kinase [Geovibrio thiophilus]
MKRYFSERPVRTQMLMMIFAVLMLQLMISGLIFSGMVADFLRFQIGEKALNIAQTMTTIPLIQKSLAERKDESGRVQAMAEDIRHKTGAAYVVVADNFGIRLSHPIKENIGRKFQGDDTDRATTRGEAYVSEAVGTLGPSVRGIAPVYHEGRIVGFVAVGYLKERVRATILEHQKKPLLFVFMMLATGLGAAVLIANHQKKITLGLEPAEIADLYLERNAIIDTIRAGIIAVNNENEIRLINKNAIRVLSLEKDYIGHHISGIFPPEYSSEVIRSRENMEDTSMTVNGVELLTNVMAVIHMGRVHGAVITFRRKNEITLLAQELNRIKKYSDILRVQSHEYSNKLHTVAGLIQLEAYQEALELILSETRIYQEMISFVNANVPDPIVSALLIGKHSRARELKIDFAIAENSRMTDMPSHIDREKIVTILGNILDNAFDAVIDSPVKQVLLTMKDSGRGIVFQVEDSGGGLEPDITEDIFKKGVSTKGENRGVGLYLVQNALMELRGSIGIAKSRLGGVSFRVTIPKEMYHEENKNGNS